MAGYLHLYVRVLPHHPLELVQLVIGFILEGPLVKVEIDVSQYTAYTHGKLAKGYGPVDRLGFRSGARKPYRFVNEDITIQLNREPIFFFLRPGDGKVGDAVTGTGRSYDNVIAKTLEAHPGVEGRLRFGINHRHHVMNRRCCS